MKATITGTLTKIYPPEQINERSGFKQRIEVTEFGNPDQANSKDKHFGIDIFYNSNNKVEELQIDNYLNKRVKAECYFNGYKYMHKVHGVSYGVNVTLKSIDLA